MVKMLGGVAVLIGRTGETTVMTAIYFIWRVFRLKMMPGEIKFEDPDLERLERSQIKRVFLDRSARRLPRPQPASLFLSLPDSSEQMDEERATKRVQRYPS